MLPEHRTRLLNVLARIDQKLAEHQTLAAGPSDAATRRRLKKVKAMLRRSRVEAERSLSQ